MLVEITGKFFGNIENLIDLFKLGVNVLLDEGCLFQNVIHYNKIVK